MNFDKKTVLAFLLIGLLLIVFQSKWYQKTFMPNTYKRAQEARQKQIEQNFAKQDSLFKDTISQDSSQQPITVPDTTRLLKPGIETLVRGDEKEIIIETPLYRTILSNIGARIKSFQLKKYLQDDSLSVELITGEGIGNLAVMFDSDIDSVDTFNMYFASEDQGIILDDSKPIHLVKYLLDFGNNKFIEKTFTFYHDKYDVGLKVKLINMGNMVRKRSYLLKWDAGMKYSQAGTYGDITFSKAYVKVGQSVQGWEVTGKPGQKVKSEKFGDDNVKWAGQRTKYFSAVMIADNFNVKQAILKGHVEKILDSKNDQQKIYAVRLEVPYYGTESSSQENNFKIFLGPLDYSLVKSYGIGMEEMMSWGWKIIKPFSIAILWSLKQLHEFIPNYGWVIILFSIIVKILLHPLTHKSYVSMQAMQELQPKMNAIKEKYGNDQKRMNEEIMKLYKSEGVNPLGGCLPMLLQMPILYALFIIFRSTIELRAAEFIWWIKDLSMPDTVFELGFNIPMYGNKVNILPLFMGVTMLIQQKMSMKDPKQKMLVYLMPIFMTLLFNQFPSGLNLYYALFNILSIIQQKFMTKPGKNKEEAGNTKTRGLTKAIQTGRSKFKKKSPF